MAAQQLLRNFQDGLKRALYDEVGDGLPALILSKYEQVTKRKREELVYIIAIPLALYLLFGFAAEFVCNLIGFAYPAYLSFIAVETPDKADDTQWLTYWTVFGVFSVTDFWANLVLKYVPFYWLLKCVFLLYLYLPVTRGAEYHYTHHLRPFFASYGPGIIKKVSNVGLKLPSPPPQNFPQQEEEEEVDGA